MVVVVYLLSHVGLLQSHGLNLPGSSVHGILLARILEWVAISFSMYLNTRALKSFHGHIMRTLKRESLKAKQNTKIIDYQI